MTEIAWQPTAAAVESANVTRLMRSHGSGTITELRCAAAEDIATFWDSVVADLAIPFARPYSRVLDNSEGIQWCRWFVDGQINLSAACVDRWAESTPRARAVVGESENGEVRTLTFAELREEVVSVAAGLRAAGVGKNEAVGVFMPMVPEALIAAYAIARIGAVYVPVFSGFAAPAVAARLNDAGARMLITAAGSWRRGEPTEMKSVADEALALCPTVERLVVLERPGQELTLRARSETWADFRERGRSGDGSVEPTESEDPFMLAYTSGTTGNPKGAVHVHGGFLVKVASEGAYQTDLKPGDVASWITDMGWIMGPWLMIAAHAAGAAVFVYEGAPDYPEPNRIWAAVEQHGITMLGVSPTLIRALKQAGDHHPAGHDLDSLRILASSGEPWNPDPYRWLAGLAQNQVPIINLSGGTEVGASFLSPYPIEPIKVCSLGGPSLGMDVDVFSPDGHSLRGQVGELVCKQPWPAMTRGIWGDRERYLDTYWSTYEGVWRHGDWATVDGDGQWFLSGRSDDTINVAGKRVGPAEVESVLVADPAVTEAAVVGVPHELKGEAIWCFCVLKGKSAPEGADDRLRELVATRLGRPFKPAQVVFIDDLPKTRSAKIMRRAIRSVILGEDPGDLSSAENPQSLDSIDRVVSKLRGR